MLRGNILECYLFSLQFSTSLDNVTRKQKNEKKNKKTLVWVAGPRLVCSGHVRSYIWERSLTSPHHHPSKLAHCLVNESTSKPTQMWWGEAPSCVSSHRMAQHLQNRCLLPPTEGGGVTGAK